MDKSPATRNAVLAFNDNINIISCYFHMMKTVKGYFAASSGNEYWETTGKHELHVLHLSPNLNVFSNLAKLIIKNWVTNGYVEPATKFADGYLCSQWCNWYIGSVGKPGVGVTNNLLESYNNSIKGLIPTSVSIISFVKDKIQLLANYYSYSSNNDKIVNNLNQIELITQLNIILPHEMIEKSRKLFSNNNNYLKYEDNYYINASKYIDNSMTIERITNHLSINNNNNNNIINSNTIDEFRYNFMSMHKVSITTTPKLHYNCDCKLYYHNAVICSHILAIMMVDKVLDFDTIFASITGPRKRGRPSGYTSALRK